MLSRSWSRYLNQPESELLTPLRATFDVEAVEGVLNGILRFLEEQSGRYFTSKNYFEAEEDYIKSANEAAAATSGGVASAGGGSSAD